jgi:L-rhamnose mutarotase
VRHILLIDLVDEPAAIAQYEAWHETGALPVAIGASIRDAAIARMDIYRSGNRLVMLMETTSDFDPVAKAQADAGNPVVQAWEAQMDNVQRPLPWADKGAKWTRAHRIFSLDDQP